MIIGAVPTNHPEYKNLYGPGMMVLWTLSNTRIGASGNYQVSFRFRAQSTGRVQGIRVYLQEGAPGYHGGNGGNIRFQIVRDDGSGRPNPNAVLGTGTYRPNSQPRGTRSIMARVDIQSTQDIVSGSLYHVLQTNIDSNPSTNYISTNNCQVYKSSSHPLRFTDPTDWATLFKAGSGAWTDFTVNGDSQKYWAPIMQVYCTGGNFGYTSMEGGSVAQRGNPNQSPTVYEYDAPFREVFTPKRDLTVKGFSLRYATTQDNTYLAYRFAGLVGALWTPWKDYHLTDVGPNKIVNGNWRDVEFDSPVQLKAGQQYPLEFNQELGGVAVSCVRTGNSLGFDQWTESIGQSFHTGAWQNWNHNHHRSAGSDSCWPVVLHLA